MLEEFVMKKLLPLLLCSSMLATGAAAAGETEEKMKKAPIDTVFAQGAINPYGKFFTGTSYLTMLSENDSVFNAPIGNVTFESKTRTNWHKHSGGQILLVLSGEGRYQERGKAVQIILHPLDPRFILQGLYILRGISQPDIHLFHARESGR